MPRISSIFGFLPKMHVSYLTRSSLQQRKVSKLGASTLHVSNLVRTWHDGTLKWRYPSCVHLPPTLGYDVFIHAIFFRLIWFLGIHNLIVTHVPYIVIQFNTMDVKIWFPCVFNHVLMVSEEEWNWGETYGWSCSWQCWWRKYLKQQNMAIMIETDSPSLWKGCFEQISFNVGFEIVRTSFKVEMGTIHRILKHERWAISREKMGISLYSLM